MIGNTYESPISGEQLRRFITKIACAFNDGSNIILIFQDMFKIRLKIKIGNIKKMLAYPAGFS